MKISRPMSHRGSELSRLGSATPDKEHSAMTAKLDPYAPPPPSLMKAWMAMSQCRQRRARAEPRRAGQDPRLADQPAAPTASTCTRSEARAHGETEQRIYLLSAWREAPCYSDRERAALGWTEALTRLSEGHAQESAYDALAGRVQRGGAGEADPDDQRHQRLEPHRRRLRPVDRAGAPATAAA